MIELAEQPQVVDYGSNDFFEAAFLHNKNKYYFSYNQFGTSKACYIEVHLMGHLKSIGDLLTPLVTVSSRNNFYKNQWYYFYHRGDYTLNNINGSLYRRNICIEYLCYDENDFIKKIKYSNRGVKLSIK